VVLPELPGSVYEVIVSVAPGESLSGPRLPTMTSGHQHHYKRKRLPRRIREAGLSPLG
jgi:hypothetical protein